MTLRRLLPALLVNLQLNADHQSVRLPVIE
jgi:hypothetical protein